LELALSSNAGNSAEGEELIAANDEQSVDDENFSLDQETDGQSAINDALNNPILQ